MQVSLYGDGGHADRPQDAKYNFWGARSEKDGVAKCLVIYTENDSAPVGYVNVGFTAQITLKDQVGVPISSANANDYPLYEVGIFFADQLSEEQKVDATKATLAYAIKNNASMVTTIKDVQEAGVDIDPRFNALKNAEVGGAKFVHYSPAQSQDEKIQLDVSGENLRFTQKDEGLQEEGRDIHLFYFDGINHNIEDQYLSQIEWTTEIIGAVGNESADTIIG
jgi:hypothetical protein